MAIVIETTQINAKFLGGWALNKIMLGIIEIFPNIATTPEPNPSDMFVNGEQGAWYDFYDSMDTKIAWGIANPGFTSAQFLTRFPSHALFQTFTGDIPVTNVEQPLGLVLDKRLGAPIKINTVDSAVGVPIGGAAFNTIDIGIPALVVGRSYNMSCAVSGYVGPGGASSVGFTGTSFAGQPAAVVDRDGVINTILVATNTPPPLLFTRADNTAVFSNVVVREIPGNHAIQATAASRPVLSARKNSLQQTENISNAYWLLGGGGTVSGDSFRPTVMAGWMQSTLGVTAPIGTAYSISLDFMPDGLNAFSAYLGSFGTDRVGVNVDVTNLTMSDFILGVALPPTNKLITDIGGGWHRLSFTALSQAAAEVLTIRSLGPNDNSNGVNGVRLTKLQLEFGPTATRYQRVNTATDYDTMGFPFSIRWNGVNNNLRTPGPVDFSGSDQLTCFFGAQRYRSAQWEEMVTVADGGQPWNESTNVFQTHVLPNSGMSCGLTTDNLGGRARSVTLFPAIPERTPFITSIGFDVGVTGNGQMPVGRLTIDGALSVAGNPSGTDQNPPMFSQRINLAGVFAGGSGTLLGETSQVVLIGRTPATQEIADTEAFIAKMMEGAIP